MRPKSCLDHLKRCLGCKSCLVVHTIVVNVCMGSHGECICMCVFVEEYVFHFAAVLFAFGLHKMRTTHYCTSTAFAATPFLSIENCLVLRNLKITATCTALTAAAAAWSSSI